MNRCFECNKKLNSIFITINTCRCKNLYCVQHMINHKCSFDYKKNEKNILEKTLVKVVPEKFVHI